MRKAWYLIFLSDFSPITSIHLLLVFFLGNCEIICHISTQFTGLMWKLVIGCVGKQALTNTYNLNLCTAPIPDCHIGLVNCGELSSDWYQYPHPPFLFSGPSTQ